MTRREALAKATITTADATAGLLDPEQSTAFIRTIKEKGNFGNQIRQSRRRSPSGEIDKMSTGSRLIRAATENADDGYRAGAAFGTVPYQTAKMRLPWEVTEDLFHENIEGQELEADLTDEMTQQFALDLDDLDINGDTAAVGADAAFLNINDGVLKQIVTANVAGRNIDASTINGGAISKAHFFEALYALPNKYRNQGNLRWLVSPNRALTWWEAMTDRAGAAGDALLGSRNAASAAMGPLNIPFWEVPQMPDSTIILASPRNFVRVITWDIRKRKVTGATDHQLAARDKRFYVFFIKTDIVIEEIDAVVRLHTFDAV